MTGDGFNGWATDGHEDQESHSKLPPELAGREDNMVSRLWIFMRR